MIPQACFLERVEPDRLRFTGPQLLPSGEVRHVPVPKKNRAAHLCRHNFYANLSSVGSFAGGREELLGHGRVLVVRRSKRGQEYATGRPPDARIDAAGGPTADSG